MARAVRTLRPARIGRPRRSSRVETYRAILQLADSTAGNIWFRGVNLTALSRAAFLPYRRQIQVVMQDPGSALDPLPGHDRAEQVDGFLDHVQ